MSNVVKKFLNYVKYDTSSDEESKSIPSTSKQLKLAERLVAELKEMGLSNASVDKNGYVMASLPSNIEKPVPAIGFIAHMDTSPETSGKDVNPQLVHNYDGSDIVLNEKENIVLSPKDFPSLKKHIGETLITTDGTTLLGADDKAGISEIMEAIDYLTKNPQVKHGTVNVAFTPDEEVGRGADYFDVKKFNSDFAYTMDGGAIGGLEYENFNAASAIVIIKGRNIHPGSAKDKMINSSLIGCEFVSMLPSVETPSNTEGYEGFYHLISFNGDVDKTKLYFIIRDHNMDLFNQRKNNMKKIAEKLNKKYGNGIVNIEIKDQYYNMKEKFKDNMNIIELAKNAMKSLGITPIITPIRGGTDGAQLSYKGLLTPNLFTGGYNYHGKYEYAVVSEMEKAVEVILKIIELNAK